MGGELMSLQRQIMAHLVSIHHKSTQRLDTLRASRGLRSSQVTPMASSTFALGGIFSHRLFFDAPPSIGFAHAAGALSGSAQCASCNGASEEGHVPRSQGLPARAGVLRLSWSQQLGGEKLPKPFWDFPPSQFLCSVVRRKPRPSEPLLDRSKGKEVCAAHWTGAQLTAMGVRSCITGAQ